MNAITFLLAEHERLRSAMTRLQKGQSSDPEKLFTEFVTDLVIHAAVEEEVFYPEIQGFAPLREKTRHAYHEHHLIDVQIDELSRMETAGQAWHDKLHVLEETLAHHLDEEEREVFPEVRRHMHAEDLDRLGDAMADMREEQALLYADDPPASAQSEAERRIAK